MVNKDFQYSNERTRAISSAEFNRLSSSRLTCAACSSELSICQHTTSKR